MVLNCRKIFWIPIAITIYLIKSMRKFTFSQSSTILIGWILFVGSMIEEVDGWMDESEVLRNKGQLIPYEFDSALDEFLRIYSLIHKQKRQRRVRCRFGMPFYPFPSLSPKMLLLLPCFFLLLLATAAMMKKNAPTARIKRTPNPFYSLRQ